MKWFVALLAELLSWLPIALGFVVGVVVAAVIFGYQVGYQMIMPPPVSLPKPFEDEDE